MRQGNGTDLLGANDPRSSTIGVIYVTPQDDRKSVLAAILTQEKLGRKQVAVVLPEHNKAFQRPIDFDDLKTMRRKLQAQIIFIAPPGPGPAEFARQRRFPVYSTLENYASALRDEPLIDGPAKKGWLFGTPRAKVEANGNGNGNGSANGNGNGRSAAREPVLATPRAQRSYLDEGEEDPGPRRFGAASLVAGAAVGGAAAMGAERVMRGRNNGSANGTGATNGASPANRAYSDPNTPPGNMGAVPASPHSFADDEDDLGPLPAVPAPSAASPAPYEDVSGPTQAIPPSPRSTGAMVAGAAAGAAANNGTSPSDNIIELPRRSSKATTPLQRASAPLPVVVPPVSASAPVAEPVQKNPLSKRTSGRIPAVGLAAGAAALGGAAVTNAVTPPRARSGNTGTIARSGTAGAAGGAAATTVPRTGGGANVPPRNPPPPGGGGGGGGPANRRRNLLLLLLIALIIALLIFGGILVFARPGSNGTSNPFSNAFKGQASATITITPASKTVQDTYTITGGSTTNAQSRQVAVRSVLGSAQAPTVTVKATGHNAHPATAAHGTLTFFNSLSVEQTVASGTVFTVNGVRIANDAPANIPAANLPTTGFVSVGAHALTTGTAGNIGAGALNGSCCGNGIVVRNDTFSGGQDAVNYTFLQQSDVNGAIAQGTKDSAKQNALADLQKQFRIGEQQTGATQCTPTTSVDQPVGDKGSNVSSANVTYLVKCTATVYDYQGAQNIVQDLLKAKANTNPGPNYVLVGAIQSSVTGQTKTGNVFSLFFSAKGIWVYQFTDAQKLQLARSIAGKSVADAQNILNATTGVASARIDYSGGNTLPTDPNQISIVIQPVAGLPSTGNGTPTAVVGSPTTTAPTVQSGTPPAGNGKGGANPPVGS
jgi:hypothetical protein